MSTPIGSIRLLVLITICAASSAAAQECSPLSAQEVRAVEAANQAYPKAWLAGEPEGVMSTLTEDAVLIPHHGDPPVEGAAAIRRHYWPKGSPPLKVTEYSMTAAETGGCSSLAYARGRFRLTFRFGPAGEEKTFSNEGNYLMIFRKSGGRWKISRFIWNDPVPQTR